MCRTVSIVPEEMHGQTRFVSYVRRKEKTRPGSSSPPPHAREQITCNPFVPAAPRSQSSPTFPDSFFLRKISTQISVCTFSPDLFKKPHRSTASLNQSCRTDSIRLSSVGSLPSVILLICMRVCAGWFGRCRRQRFASEIYVCKKHSAVSSDDDCERNAEKADGDAGLFSRT